ncbi:hypothetical protein BH11BAC2_BH11BAC2_19740 [soil metagenome]
MKIGVQNYCNGLSLRPMNSKVFASLIILLLPFTVKSQDLCNCPSQAPVGKGTMYVAVGYNLDYFSKSDIRFRDHGVDHYDVTFHDVTADDRPGLKDVFHQDISIPQYSFRIGYYFNKKKDWGIEINYDHAKYVVDHGQTVHMTGNIRGVEYDTDTIIGGSSFLDYEHTNGANFAMMNALRRVSFIHSKNNLHWLSAVGKAGVGFVYPRTDVTFLGAHRNDHFHVAGYIVGLDVGIRYDFLKHFFFETSGKGAFVNYTDVLLPETARGNHHFWSFEYIMTIGFQFNI